MTTAAANTEPLPPIRARGIVQPITEDVTRNVDEHIRRRVTADRTTGSEDDDRSRRQRQRDYGDDPPRWRWGFAEYIPLPVVIAIAIAIAVVFFLLPRFGVPIGVGTYEWNCAAHGGTTTLGTRPGELVCNQPTYSYTPSYDESLSKTPRIPRFDAPRTVVDPDI